MGVRRWSGTVVLCAGLGVGAVACGVDARSPDGATGSAVLRTEEPSSTSQRAAPSVPVSPSPTVVYRPPYVEYVEWVETEVGPSLQIHPTTAGRYTDDPVGADTAWAEVLAFDASSAMPGMRAQFDCHWTFARLVEPEKPSWNLEPRRPVVDAETMIRTRCNPGMPEEG